MATKIAIRLEFVYDSDKSVEFTDCVNHERDSTKKGRENLAREVLAELRKAVSFADHLAVLPSVPNLADSSNYVRTDPMAFMDSFNVPALWLEISNTFIDLRNLLALAKAYKSVEPLNTTPLSDSLCAHVHFEKMYKLNLAVYQLVKIQDLVVRLLQEGFSGKLIAVDYDDEDWELKLTLQAAKQGLATLRKSGKLAKKEYEEIMTALGQPSKSPHRKTVLNYRNRLTHRIRPSVDYRQIYTHLQDRVGKVVRDSAGRVTRTCGIGSGGTVPEFTFDDLYTAISDYMRHVADMLKALKRITRLS